MSHDDLAEGFHEIADHVGAAGLPPAVASIRRRGDRRRRNQALTATLAGVALLGLGTGSVFAVSRHDGGTPPPVTTVRPSPPPAPDVTSAPQPSAKASRPRTTSAETTTPAVTHTAPSSPSHPPSARTPTVPDGTRTMLLFSYDSAAGKAVVQQAEVKPGAQDNATVVGAGDRLTVPVDAAVKLFSVNGGDPSCMAGTGYDIAGSCLTTNAKFQKLIVGEHGLAVRVAARQGRVHEISELYLP